MDIYSKITFRDLLKRHHKTEFPTVYSSTYLPKYNYSLILPYETETLNSKNYPRI